MNDMRRNPIAPSFPNPTEQYADYFHDIKRNAAWNRNFAQLSIALKTYNPYKAGINWVKIFSVLIYIFSSQPNSLLYVTMLNCT